MTFYTLKYDVLCPTVQQLNIPTNTDYKVGVKVARGVDEVDLGDGRGVTLGGLSSEGLEDGYVTFAKSSGDEASLGEDTVSVDIRPAAVENYLTGYATKPFPWVPLQQFRCNVGLDDFAGQSIAVGDFYCAAVPDSTSTQDAEDALSGAFDLQPSEVSGVTQRIAIDNFVTVYGYFSANSAWDAAVRAMTPEERSQYIVGELPAEGVKYALFKQNQHDAFTPVEKVEVAGGMNLLIMSNASSTSQPFALGVKVTDGKVPFNASFRLRTNVYRSQEGDVEGFKPSGTVKIEGTDASGSAFSFDAITA